MKRYFEENSLFGEERISLAINIGKTCSVLTNNLHFEDLAELDGSFDGEGVDALFNTTYEAYLMIGLCEAVIKSADKETRQRAYEEAKGQFEKDRRELLFDLLDKLEPNR